MKYFIYAFLVGFIVFGFVFLKNRRKKDKTVYYTAETCRPIKEKAEEGSER